MYRRNALRLVVELILAGMPAIVFASGADVPDYRQNGWSSPVDYRSHENCYQFGQYNGHVGNDLCREANTTSIVAIADGCVENYDTAASDYGGVGIKGGVILLRHYTTDNDVKPVFTVYGHGSPETAYLDARKCGKGTIVKRGDKIATVHPYYGKDKERMDHLHLGTRPNEKDPEKEFRGNRCVDSSGNTRPDNCGWVEPFAFLMSHHPAILISKGEKDFSQVGKSYILDGSTLCSSATRVYKIVDGGDEQSNIWITEEKDKDAACQEIMGVHADVIQTTRDNGGTISTNQLVDPEKKTLRSAISSWLSKLASFFHQLVTDARTPTALAAEPSIQQQLAVSRKGQVYAIEGTEKQIVILTGGPGMNGDKAINSTPYSEPDPSESYVPQTGSNASGTRPDLVSTDLWTERSSGNPWTTIAWGDTVCLVASVKNAGNADTPTDVKVSFYVSKGNHEDKDPRHAGYMMAKKSDLTKARTAKAIVKRCINKSEDDYPSPYPGTFNFGVHVDSDNRVAESNEKNNWKGERVFTLTENSHLAISQFWLSNPTPQSGETVTAYVKIRNAGTPFGSDKVNTEWRIQGPQYGPDPIILGFDQTKREHLRTNDEAGEDISFVVPTTPGNYTLTVEVDYDFRTTQSDRSGNAASLTITIPWQSEEEGDDPNAQVPCPVITQTNWVSGGWSVRGYSAPFGTDGTILINPSCKKSQPNSLEVTIGNANNPNMVAYMTAYIRDKTTGADMPYPLTCSGLVNNGWCAGTATLTAENSGINTTSNGDPTIFFGYTCELVNGAFQCPPYWQIQGAGLP